MINIGSFEAKTHLPRLLKDVEEGQIITITRRGRPIARLVPVPQDESGQAQAAAERLKRFRKNRPSVSADDIRHDRHEGHRF
jgi:prevent-host-death family protein